MKPQSQIVTRLLRQKSRIYRMLSPGSKGMREQRSAWIQSSVAPDLGGRKFEIAASQMRILRKEKLGSLHFERIQKMVHAIQANFQNAQNLLHLRSKNQSSSWPEVGLVFPNSLFAPAETPSNAGELRQGSIIQKFSTFPKPGQSLDLFKEQVQQKTVLPESEIGPSKSRSLSPGDRLFSRVQELTADQKDKKYEPANIDKPIASSAQEFTERTQRTIKQDLPYVPSKVRGEFIQRQGEQALPHIAHTESKSSATRKTDKLTIAAAQPTQPPRIARHSDLPAAPPVKRESEPVVQRLSETNKPSQLQEIDAEKNTPQPAAKLHTPKENDSSEGQLELPLKNYLEHRRAAFEAMRPSSLGQDLPAMKHEALTFSNPLIQRSPTIPKTIASPLSYPDLPALHELAVWPEDTTHRVYTRSVDGVVHPALPPTQLLQRTISGPRENETSRRAEPVQTAQVAHGNFLHSAEPFSSESLVQNKPARPLISTQPGSTQNVIRRISDDESVSGQSPNTQNRHESVDIHRLAEKIFPLVKQLLEIESERTGNMFR